MKLVAIAIIIALTAIPFAATLAHAEDAAPTPPDVLGDREFLRSNYSAAETYYRAALTARPDDLHSLSRLALLLTWRGEYKEAIELYQRGLQREPANLELKRGLATAWTWSEQYDEALTLYSDMLRERPSDERLSYEMAQAQAWSGDNAAARSTLLEMLSRNPRHLKARLLLAQVHGWSGDPEAGERIYRSVLSEDPGNVAALTGLGDSLAAQGRHDEALASYDKALALDSANRQALEGRARVFQAQGRTPEALDAVRQALELYPDARDARRLGREIGGPLRPTLQLFAATTRDTDDNDVSTWGGTYTHYLGGRGYAGLAWNHAQTNASFEDPPLINTFTPVARYDSLRLIGGWHASRHFSLYGEAGPERTELPVNTDPNTPPTPLPYDSRQHFSGSLTFEVNGGDWFTLVGSASRERLVGTTQAFMNDIGIEAASLTTIFRPHPSVRIRITRQKALFTDDDEVDVNAAFEVHPDAGTDNERDRDLLTAGVSWRIPLRRPRLTLNYKYRWMSYEENLDSGDDPIRHGYFDPENYVTNTVGFDLTDTVGRHFYWGVGMDSGAQAIDRFRSPSLTPKHVHTTHNHILSYRGLAGLNIGEHASFEAYYAHSDSALSTPAGFKSREGGVRLVIKFGGSYGPASPARRSPADSGGTSD